MVLNVLAKTTENLGGALSSERIELSLEMTVLGLLAVFSVLAIIWLVLVMFKLFFYRDPSKNGGINSPCVKSVISVCKSARESSRSLRKRCMSEGGTASISQWQTALIYSEIKLSASISACSCSGTCTRPSSPIQALIKCSST